MLAKQNRMTKAEQFRLVMRSGSKASNHLLFVSVALPKEPTDSETMSNSETMVGLVVPKRAIPRAVDRNLVKRRLRNLMRAQLDTVVPGTRIVITAKAPAKDSTFAELQNALTLALRRAVERASQ